MAKYFGRYDSIDEILQQMTLEQKARLVIGGSPFHSEALPELGIPEVYMLDSCHGVNYFESAVDHMYRAAAAAAAEKGEPLDREKNSTMGGLVIGLYALQKAAAVRAKSGAAPEKKENNCYPPGIALGSTWNPDVIERVGTALAGEMAAHGVDMILGPNVNIHRDPLCGRLGESYSEDPKLISVLTPAMIRGIQKTGLLACVKHFAANNQEKDRLGVNEHISERTLREIYLPGFKACIKAGCKTIMSAYNCLNGVPSAQNEWLLKDVLRKEWGFDGFVVSDWGAAYDQIKSIAAGTDLTMPGPRGIQCIIDAVNDGSLPVDKLDFCVRNILRVIAGSTAVTKKYPAYDKEESLAAIKAALRESMILLENDGTLPLADDTPVALYGKRSTAPVICPEGSSKVESDLTINLAEGIREIAGDAHLTVDHAADDTKVWVVTVGANGHEGSDRDTLDIDPDDAEVLETAIAEAAERKGKVVVIINATGPVNLLPYIGRVHAILCPFFAGTQGGLITAEAIYGRFNPSGKLPLTWPKHEYDTPAYKNYGGENKEVWYGEGIYVGYRWYDARHIAPLYPFGYGLSYTTFRITDVSVPQDIRIHDEALPVKVTVKNTGATAGSEVVQVYVHPQHASVDRPEKELKGFAKIFLNPGEEKTVTVLLTEEDFSVFYARFGTQITEPGKYDILVGTSAGEINESRTVEVRCRNPLGLSERSAIGAIAKDAEAIKAVNDLIEDDILARTAIALEYGPDKTFEELWNGADIQNFLHGKGWSDDVIAEKFEQILAAFSSIEDSRI